MLESLSVRNVVLIDKLDIEFAEGLSILSGETGAGKSVLLDSLGLVLGQRADTSLIRSGTDKLSVTAVFSAPPADSPLTALAEANDIELEESLVIKRTLGTDGKSKIFVNDQPVSLKLLKEFGAGLVEIHGQFDNQGLLNPANHLEILDSYGQYSADLAATRAAFEKYRRACAERREAESRLQAGREEEDNLRHWVDELARLKPVAGEEDELNRRRTGIMNAEKLVESLNAAYAALSGSADVTSAIRHAQSAIDKADAVMDGGYRDIADALEQALLNAEEAIRGIEEASSSLSYNQNEAEAVEQRLFALRGAARKHQVGVDELPQKLEEMRQRLSALELGEEELVSLLREEERCRRDYLEKAGRLSALRRQTAAELDKRIMLELPPLKMEKARFVTMVGELPESGWGAAGIDSVCFTVSTNPNSPQGPLNKIASGGELARFMLALKVNLVKSAGSMTMVFDEVDAGIGGATAQAVGSRLAALAENVQVLLVTHSPQVAACGNHHFKVEKKTQNNITTTYVNRLSPAEREEEIARMLAGEKITDEARAAAKVLIKSK